MYINSDFIKMQFSGENSVNGTNALSSTSEADSLFGGQEVQTSFDEEIRQSEFTTLKYQKSLNDRNEIFELMLDGKEQFGHFTAAMPQTGQGRPELLEKFESVFNAGCKIYSNFLCGTAETRSDYEKALEDPNVSVEQLKTLASRCKENIEEELKKAEEQFEKLTLVAQACMELAVLDERTTGGIDSNETIQGLNMAAEEIIKHPSDEKDKSGIKNDKSDKNGVDMTRQLEELNSKIEAKTNQIEDPDTSQSKKRGLQNELKALNVLKETYEGLIEGKEPMWKTRQ